MAGSSVPAGIHRLLILVVAATSLIWAAPAGAEVIHVASPAELQTALALVGNGDIIELAAGTYAAPASGFEILNPGRSFTVRGAAGATVVLSGEGTHPVLEVQNSVVEPDVSLVFENLVFADGRTLQDGISAGVTLVRATATFVGCTFEDCATESDDTGGGGAAVFSSSIAHFFDCEFSGNSALTEGGALKVGGGSFAAVHDSRFIANRTDVPNHRHSAAGGAVHVGNASVLISNTRFQANRSGFAGGALYVIGSWNGTSAYAGEAVVVNSTFEDNVCAPAVGVTPPSPTSGGAINVEDDARVRIFNSRLRRNQAESGGGLSSYRGAIEITSSVLEDNRATGDGSSAGLGGAVAAGSNDTSDDGLNNRPSAVVSVLDSLIIGHSGGGALKGGCLYAQGDTNRQFGFSGVTQMGTAADNRAVLTVTGTALLGCDVVRDGAVTGTGAGGAISANLVDLEVQGSIVAGARAIGLNSAGAGMRISNDSTAVISATAFADNRADNSGAGLWVIGSHIEITGCSFSGHDLETGDYGSLLWLAPWDERNLDVTGEFANNVVTGNGQVEIWDQDPAGGNQIMVEFNRNQFDLGGGDDTVYRSIEIGSLTVSDLNASPLSSQPNTVLASAPDLAALLAVPPATIPVAAAGDPSQTTASYLAYAWSGGTARLDGALLSTPTGAIMGAAGNHTLTVGGSHMNAPIAALPAPAASLHATPSSITRGESSSLGWSTSGTSFLTVGIDRNVTIANPAPTGTTTVTPDGSSLYRLTAVYQEGGAVAQTPVWVDEAPLELFADGFEGGTAGAWSAVFGD